MDIGERVLYHQIHPLKLATDISTALAASGLLWQHHLGAALAVGFIPSIVVSAALLRWANLDGYRTSTFGRYVARFMTRRVEMARFAGLVPLWGGAWRRSAVTMVGGGAWIIGCWLWGLTKHD